MSLKEPNQTPARVPFRPNHRPKMKSKVSSSLFRNCSIAIFFKLNFAFNLLMWLAKSAFINDWNRAILSLQLLHAQNVLVALAVVVVNGIVVTRLRHIPHLFGFYVLAGSKVTKTVLLSSVIDCWFATVECVISKTMKNCYWCLSHFQCLHIHFDFVFDVTNCKPLSTRHIWLLCHWFNWCDLKNTSIFFLTEIQ